MNREQHKASTNVHIQHLLYKDLKCKTAQTNSAKARRFFVYMVELRSGFRLTIYVTNFFSRQLYDNKKTTVLYIYDTPTCCSLQWPLSGRWLTKERTAANYVTDVQLKC